MKLASLGGWPGVTAAALATAGAVIAGAYYAGLFGAPAPEGPDAPATVAALEPAAKSAPVATPDNETTAAEAGGSETPAATGAASEAEPPRFDVVRMEADGSALIAGQARPDSTVAVLVDGTEVGRETAGGDGKFVSFVDIAPSDAPRVVTLLMSWAGGELASVDQVILGPTVARPVAEAPAEPEAAPIEVAAAPADDAVVPGAGDAADAPSAGEGGTADAQAGDAAPEAPAAPEAVVADTASAPEPDASAQVAATPGAATADAPEPVAEAAAAPAPEAVADASPAPAADAAPADPEPADPAQVAAAETAATTATPAAAPTVILSSEEGVRVLQSSRPEVMDEVAIDQITYSDEGEVELAGRGTGGDYVRIYLDDKPVAGARIAPDGTWRTSLPNVDTGVYRLRVDQTGADGKVRSRVETPFKREAPAAVAVAAESPAPTVTVQPGSTLWAIARDRYGEGVLYVRVFEANRDLIRNPDLIYPGQIFNIPASE